MRFWSFFPGIFLFTCSLLIYPKLKKCVSYTLPYFWMSVDDSVVQNFKKIGFWFTCLRNRRWWTSVNSLVSGAYCSEKSLALCLQLRPRLWFCPAQNKSCIWSRPRNMVNYISFTLSITRSLILRFPSLRHVAQDSNMGAYTVCEFFLLAFCLSTGRVPVPRARTASDSSSNPERDKRPTWENTQAF